MIKIKTLVIVPAFNEEESIKKVIKEIKKNNTNVDVVVVNDGSEDKTLIEAKSSGAVVLDLPYNLGIGGAIQSGYLYAYKYGYDIADRIKLFYDGEEDILDAFNEFADYIKEETLATEYVQKHTDNIIDIHGHDVFVTIEKN